MGRRGRYSDDFKREAVAMVTPDRPIEEVAVRLGVAPGTLWHWVEKAHDRQRASTTPGDAEVVAKALYDAALKRIQYLEQENEFLGKASAYFAGKVQRKP